MEHTETTMNTYPAPGTPLRPAPPSPNARVSQKIEEAWPTPSAVGSAAELIERLINLEKCLARTLGSVTGEEYGAPDTPAGPGLLPLLNSAHTRLTRCIEFAGELERQV